MDLKNLKKYWDSQLTALHTIWSQRLAAYAKGIDQNIDTTIIDNVWRQQLGIPTLTNEEWLILWSAMVPHLSPGFYEQLVFTFFPKGGELIEMGGCKTTPHRGMLPTGETIQFLLAGMNIAERLKVQQHFIEERYTNLRGIVTLDSVKVGEPYMSGRLNVDKEWFDQTILGIDAAPQFGPDFPAKKISSQLTWADAVLHPHTKSQIEDIQNWVRHAPLLLKDVNLSRKVKPGYRALFYGPSGTGKTMTAALLGKAVNKDVYRIDLSQIVSKYIGETEKNLEQVFIKASHKDWVLFFDEADALFGKRTQVQSSHDRYANQEVSYLLQRIEDFPGLLILASNFKNNMDDAFLRRFHAVIHFPMPQAAERLMLWEKVMPDSIPLAEEVDLRTLAKQYELTGASILNAVQYAIIKTLSREKVILQQADLIEGIRKEYAKDDKSL